MALLTGAGASVPLNLPDTQSFLRAFEQQLAASGSGLQNWLRTTVEATGTVDAEFLLDTIDDWLTQLDGTWNLPLGQFENQVRTALQPAKEGWEGLKIALRRTIVETYGRVDAAAAVQLYRPLLLEAWPRFALGRTLPVFTTNYDTAIETVAVEAGLELDFVDGFRPGPMGLRWDATVYHDYQTRRRKGVDLVLLKLHGSSNWYLMPGGSIQKMDNFELDPGNLKTIMIFPTQRKTDYLGNEPFDTSYSYFKGCLARLRVLVVIGSSFRDSEIRRLIVQTLSGRSDFSVLVIDPGFNWDGLIGRLSEGEVVDYHGQVGLVQTGFGKQAAITEIENFLHKRGLITIGV